MAKAKKQTVIPGTERQGNKKVATAAEKYVEIRDERMALTRREVEARDALLSAMREAGLSTYVDEDADPQLEVVIVPGEEKVKVRRLSDEDEAEAA